jgi:hypothetical protein
MRVASNTISVANVISGVRVFANREPRDAMYKVASKLIASSWGHPEEVADALGVLLLTWNQAFYRYGPLSFDAIQQVLHDYAVDIDGFRKVDILSVAVEPSNLLSIRSLYTAMLGACSIRTRKKGELRQSPVSAAKALHMLAPATFPLWDDKIALALGLHSGWPSKSGARYVDLMLWCRDLAQKLGDNYEP